MGCLKLLPLVWFFRLVWYGFVRAILNWPASISILPLSVSPGMSHTKSNEVQSQTITSSTNHRMSSTGRYRCQMPVNVIELLVLAIQDMSIARRHWWWSTAVLSSGYFTAEFGVIYKCIRIASDYLDGKICWCFEDLISGTANILITFDEIVNEECWLMMFCLRHHQMSMIHV